MRLAFIFKAYKSKRNRLLRQKIDVAGIIYNHCIALHKKYYKIYKKYLNVYELSKHITKLKKRNKYHYWKILGSQAIQDIIQRIDRAYTAFFRNLKSKSKRRVNPPTFKKVKKYKSFTLKQVGYKILGGNRIKIGKITYKFSKSREIEGGIKTLTIKRDSLGDIYFCFSCEVKSFSQNRVASGKMAGFDFGLKTFLTCSDESEIESPEFLKKGLNDIRKASRKFSSKKKGSNNHKKSRLNLARAHKSIANRRKDYHFKLAKKLAKEYDNLFFEDLNISAMQKLWGRKVSDLGFSMFINVLKHQCNKHGSKVRFLDRYFASTKRCHVCWKIVDNMTLQIRSWTCPYCCTFHHRDSNAAKCILIEGASSIGLGDVRLALAPAIPA